MFAMSIPACAESDVPNTIDCAAFSKRADGAWYVSKQSTTFAFGPVKSLTLEKRQLVKSRSLSFGGADLFQAVEKKCGR